MKKIQVKVKDLEKEETKAGEQTLHHLLVIKPIKEIMIKNSWSKKKEMLGLHDKHDRGIVVIKDMVEEVSVGKENLNI